MLCELCASIDFIPPRNTDAVTIIDTSARKHHKSFETLRDAADNGCDLCRLIVKAADNFREDRYWRQPYLHSEVAEPEREQVYFAFGTYLTFEIAARSPAIDKVLFHQKSHWGDKSGFGAPLALFAPPDSQLAKNRILLGRPVAKRADSEQCFDLICQWMNECVRDHGDFCPAFMVSPLPSRVIDVGSSEVPPKIVISNGRNGRWLALSHCWGTNSRFVLDSTNIQSRQQSIPLIDMPNAFSDAIRVTRKLGYQYLWIDSLCIIQDSHDDWVYESSQMLKYYQNSSLTVALDDTAGDEHGFLDVIRTSDEDAVQAPAIVPPANEGEINSAPMLELVSIRGLPTNFGSGSCFLATRGWTLQEDILSPRTIHYRSSHLAWECQTHRKYELYEGTRDFTGDQFASPKQHFLRSPQNLVLRGSWYKILEAYMRRQLTIPQDKLPALAGLARKVGEQTGYTYKAGIWLEQFHGGLLWHCGSPEKRSSDECIAPSWSWASMKTTESRPAHVSWCFGPTPACTDNSVGSRAELLDCQVKLAGPDIYGQVQDASITLRSDFLPLSDWPVKWPIVLNAGQWPQTARAWVDELACHFDEALSQPNGAGDVDVFSIDTLVRDISLLQIGNWVSNVSSVNGGTISFFLLLSPATDGKFRRIGTAEALLSQCETLENWRNETVTIV